jgi:hypothetical protein
MIKMRAIDPDRTPLLGAFVFAVVAVVTFAASSAHLFMR